MCITRFSVNFFLHNYDVKWPNLSSPDNAKGKTITVYCIFSSELGRGLHSLLSSSQLFPNSKDWMSWNTREKVYFSRTAPDCVNAWWNRLERTQSQSVHFQSVIDSGQLTWKRLVWPAEILLWKNNARCSESALQWSLDFSFLVVYILADHISLF